MALASSWSTYSSLPGCVRAAPSRAALPGGFPPPLRRPPDSSAPHCCRHEVSPSAKQYLTAQALEGHADWLMQPSRWLHPQSCSLTMPGVLNISVPCPAMPRAGWQIMNGSGWGLPGVGSRAGGCWGSTVLDAGCHPRAVAWYAHDPDGCACSWCGGASGPRWPGALHAAACTCTTEHPGFRGWGYDGWPQMMDCA